MSLDYWQRVARFKLRGWSDDNAASTARAQERYARNRGIRWVTITEPATAIVTAVSGTTIPSVPDSLSWSESGWVFKAGGHGIEGMEKP